VEKGRQANRRSDALDDGSDDVKRVPAMMGRLGKDHEAR